MSNLNFYRLCRIVVGLRLKGMSEGYIRVSMMLTNLDVDDIDEILALTKG
jgi:hypothetical protein